MTSPNVHIRHAVSAVSLILDGALRHIEELETEEARHRATVTLFDAVQNELIDWDIDGSLPLLFSALLQETQARFSEADRKLLAQLNLLP